LRRGLADKDPVQASEKLYKAAEEAVKALAVCFSMEDILKVVGGRVDGLFQSLRRLFQEYPGSWVIGLALHGIERTIYMFGDFTGKARLRCCEGNARYRKDGFRSKEDYLWIMI
jgi:hypothetical protein